jgi:hypothetical protein
MTKKSKATKKNSGPRLVHVMPPVKVQNPGPDTPVPVPLGTIQAISEFINQATGPCQLAMQIMQSLQLSVDRAGLGRRAAEAQKK